MGKKCILVILLIFGITNLNPVLSLAKTAKNERQGKILNYGFMSEKQVAVPDGGALHPDLFKKKSKPKSLAMTGGAMI